MQQLEQKAGPGDMSDNGAAAAALLYRHNVTTRQSQPAANKQGKYFTDASAAVTTYRPTPAFTLRAYCRRPALGFTASADSNNQSTQVTADEAAAWLTGGKPDYDTEWPVCKGACIAGVCALNQAAALCRTRLATTLQHQVNPVSRVGSSRSPLPWGTGNPGTGFAGGTRCPGGWACCQLTTAAAALRVLWRC